MPLEPLGSLREGGGENSHVSTVLCGNLICHWGDLRLSCKERADDMTDHARADYGMPCFLLGALYLGVGGMTSIFLTPDGSIEVFS
jgi:hypothetical protein